MSESARWGATIALATASLFAAIVTAQLHKSEHPRLQRVTVSDVSTMASAPPVQDRCRELSEAALKSFSMEP